MTKTYSKHFRSHQKTRNTSSKSQHKQSAQQQQFQSKYSQTKHKQAEKILNEFLAQSPETQQLLLRYQHNPTEVLYNKLFSVIHNILKNKIPNIEKLIIFILLASLITQTKGEVNDIVSYEGEGEYIDLIRQVGKIECKLTQGEIKADLYYNTNSISKELVVSATKICTRKLTEDFNKGQYTDEISKRKFNRTKEKLNYYTNTLDKGSPTYDSLSPVAPNEIEKKIKKAPATGLIYPQSAFLAKNLRLNNNEECGDVHIGILKKNDVMTFVERCDLYQPGAESCIELYQKCALAISQEVFYAGHLKIINVPPSFMEGYIETINFFSKNLNSNQYRPRNLGKINTLGLITDTLNTFWLILVNIKENHPEYFLYFLATITISAPIVKYIIYTIDHLLQPNKYASKHWHIAREKFINQYSDILRTKSDKTTLRALSQQALNKRMKSLDNLLNTAFQLIKDGETFDIEWIGAKTLQSILENEKKLKVLKSDTNEILTEKLNKLKKQIYILFKGITHSNQEAFTQIKDRLTENGRDQLKKQKDDALKSQQLALRQRHLEMIHTRKQRLAQKQLEREQNRNTIIQLNKGKNKRRGKGKKLNTTPTSHTTSPKITTPQQQSISTKYVAPQLIQVQPVKSKKRKPSKLSFLQQNTHVNELFISYEKFKNRAISALFVNSIPRKKQLITQVKIKLMYLLEILNALSKELKKTDNLNGLHKQLLALRVRIRHLGFLYMYHECRKEGADIPSVTLELDRFINNIYEALNSTSPKPLQIGQYPVISRLFKEFTAYNHYYIDVWSLIKDLVSKTLGQFKSQNDTDFNTTLQIKYVAILNTLQAYKLVKITPNKKLNERIKQSKLQGNLTLNWLLNECGQQSIHDYDLGKERFNLGEQKINLEDIRRNQILTLNPNLALFSIQEDLQLLENLNPQIKGETVLLYSQLVSSCLISMSKATQIIKSYNSKSQQPEDKTHLPAMVTATFRSKKNMSEKTSIRNKVNYAAHRATAAKYLDKQTQAFLGNKQALSKALEQIDESINNILKKVNN